MFESALTFVSSKCLRVDLRVKEVNFVDSSSNPSCRSRIVDSSPYSTLFLC